MPSHPLRILVVDDEADLLTVYELLFAEEGYHVETYTSARDALSNVRPRAWDVVFTDRVMPGMDGEEFAEEVKRVDPSIPVVMVTGHVPKGCCQGVDVIISKPFDLPKLQRAMEKAMQLVSTVKGAQRASQKL